MDNTNNKNNIGTTNNTGAANTINHFGNNSGASNNQFDNPNYGVPNRAGYAYIPDQTAAGGEIGVVTKKRHAVSVALSVLLLIFIIIAMVLYELGLLPWFNNEQRVENYMRAYHAVDFIGGGSILGDDMTNAMVKTAMDQKVDNFFDDLWSDIDDAEFLLVFHADGKAKGLLSKVKDAVEKWHEDDKAKARDIIAKMQAEADALPADEAVQYWLEPASFSLIADVNETLAYDVDDDFRNAKCELLDYLASILSQTDYGKSYVESNARWHNYECGGKQ